MHRLSVAAAVLLLAIAAGAQLSTDTAAPATATHKKPTYRVITLYNFTTAQLRMAARGGELDQFLNNDMRNLEAVLAKQSDEGFTLVAAVPMSHDLSILTDAHPHNLRAEAEQVRLIFNKN